MILSRCEIHRGCTIEVFFGEKAGGRIPWPDRAVWVAGEPLCSASALPRLVLLPALDVTDRRTCEEQPYVRRCPQPSPQR